MRQVHLRPRLAAVAEMLTNASLADIGCDHGKLCAFLLQQKKVPRAIGIDCSAASLQKAHALRTCCALHARWEIREGDGLHALHPGEAAQLSFCGMGGELIASLLAACPDRALAAERIVMQPMGGAAELRAYLYRAGYGIYDERLVRDAGRIYQLIAAMPGKRFPPPSHFPGDCFAFGPRLFEKRDPLLLPLLEAHRLSHQKRLERARAKGREPEALLRILAETDTLIKLAKGELPL